jgi:hypothetical protein
MDALWNELRPELCNISKHDLTRVELISYIPRHVNEKTHHNRQWHMAGVGSHVYSRRSNRTTLKWPQNYGKKTSYVKKLLNNDWNLWDTTPCRWISSARSFKRKQCLRKVGSHPTTRYQVPEDMNAQTTLRKHQSSQTVKCCILFKRVLII